MCPDPGHRGHRRDRVRRLATTGLAISLAVSLAVAVAGCAAGRAETIDPQATAATPTALPTGTTTGTSTDPATTTPAGVDPRSIEGPSTAVLADEHVHPVSDNPVPQLPVTVRSYDGVDVTITSVDRIVAVDMNGTLGEITWTLGLGPNQVGRDLSTDFPEAADVPIVTVGGHQLSAEAILDLNPTVVLTDEGIGPPEVPRQLREAGIPVVFFDPERSIEAIPSLVTSVAAALGVPDLGAQLHDRIQADLDAARGLAPAGYPPLRIAFLYVRGSAGVYLMSGPGSGADSLIEAIGGIDVGTDIGLPDSFVPITSEALINGAPDVILVMTHGLESVGGVEGLLKIPGVAQTPAGEHHRIVDMDDGVILSFGPRIGETIRALAQAIYAPAATE